MRVTRSCKQRLFEIRNHAHMHRAGRLVRWIATVVIIVAVDFPVADAQPSVIDHDAIDVASSIESVTVFRQEANVIREIQVAPSTSMQTLRVSGLPQAMRIHSIRCEPSPTINVRSVRVLSHVEVRDRKQEEQQNASIAQTQQAIEEAQQNVAAIERDLMTIENLVQFSAKQANHDLRQATLDAESITEIADFVMQRRRALAKELLKAQHALRAKQQELEGIIAEISEETDSDTEQTFDAIIRVDATEGGPLRLSYWVDDVSWQPSYTIRATSNVDVEDEIMIQLDGHVSQSSGEDWKGVKLVLCTGVPDVKADGPVLAPLRVTVDGASSKFDSPGLGGDQSIPAWVDPGEWQTNLRLNADASTKQVQEINQPASVQRDLASDAGQNVSDETYVIEREVDVPHRAIKQSVTVLQSTVKGDIYRVVVPLLSSFAYREVEVENRSGENLVGGDAMVFLDGRFVGRTTVPPTAAGGELLLGFGADRQVRTRRELLERTVEPKGGNRLTTLKYRLVISNFHDQAVDVHLFDRLPISDSETAIDLIADETSLGTLSDDAKYLRLVRPTGILRWDLQVPAKRFGSDAYDHHYQFTIEMDRTKTITGTDLQRQINQDLQFQRFNGGGMGGGMGGAGGGGAR
ncbi:mucoidy inhibitor MuiA family protein [Roseiconus lacunae]|uniref:mucoidy inhibitor MuiA family protein n=2 Tax=Roseiconus lacunae TaxID=2605694 RepID=UPI00135A07E9|nr:mucoidy inhibitor MuiA family protein [Roseiconus lacunae]